MDAYDLSFIRDVGSTIRNIFLLPGDFVLAQIAGWAPQLAAIPGVTAEGSAILSSSIVSLLAWSLLALLFWKMLGFGRDILRNITAVIRTFAHRSSQSMRGLKTWLVCQIRPFVPKPRSNVKVASPEVELDDLDLAVLHAALVRGPAFALSAPELADQFKLRSVQVQRSLEKLSKSRMLDQVVGSADGFENYRLTRTGAAFIAMWRRRGIVA